MESKTSKTSKTSKKSQNITKESIIQQLITFLNELKDEVKNQKSFDLNQYLIDTLVAINLQIKDLESQINRKLNLKDFDEVILAQNSKRITLYDLLFDVQNLFSKNIIKFSNNLNTKDFKNKNIYFFQYFDENNRANLVTQIHNKNVYSKQEIKELSDIMAKINEYIRVITNWDDSSNRLAYRFTMDKIKDLKSKYIIPTVNPLKDYFGKKFNFEWLGSDNLFISMYHHFNRLTEYYSLPKPNDWNIEVLNLQIKRNCLEDYVKEIKDVRYKFDSWVERYLW